MIVYFSGDNEVVNSSVAEALLPSEVSVMLTYACHSKKNDRDDWRIKLMQNEPGRVVSHFLDSGAFTLWTTGSAEWAANHGGDCWGYYDTDEFYEYMDSYSSFVKKYQSAIDLYANVDAIPHGELTHRNQKYLEKEHGLKPVPVVHLAQDSPEWLRRYIDEGYELIGLGGLAGKASAETRRRWLDRCFELVCDNSKRLPCVKLHGFGVTSYKLLIRFPWWSVDSVTWAKQAGFGSIFVPHKRGGSFVYDIAPYQIHISLESGKTVDRSKHYLTITDRERSVVDEWLDFIGVPLGKMNGKDIEEFGVLNRHTERRTAMMKFFNGLSDSLPQWPWSFRKIRPAFFT